MSSICKSVQMIYFPLLSQVQLSFIRGLCGMFIFQAVENLYARIVTRPGKKKKEISIGEIDMYLPM